MEVCTKIKALIFKQWLSVTLGSVLLLGVSFLVYLVLFTLLERLGNPSGQYGFVSFLRIGYGIFLMVLCICLYFTKIFDWLKACFLTVGMSTLLIAISVQLYYAPWIFITLSAFVILTGLFILSKLKKKWYHYYAILLVIPFLILYL